MMRNNLSLLAVVGAALLVGTTANLTGQTSSSATKPVSPAPVSLVAKEYPDGTRQVVRWSDLGAGEIDRGETHGGPPKIVPFDAQRDGFVPIGQTNGTTGHVGLAPASDMSSSSQPLMRPKKLEPYEPDLLYARFQVGTTFLNDQSVQQVDGVSTTTNLTFDPGLRGMFEVGGNLMEYLALEGNIGASWNSCNQGTSAALYQIPAMIGLLG